jgi:hypothetical protein
MSDMDNNQEDKINQYDKLVVDISNNLTTRLTDLMSKLLNSAQDKLFNLSDEADNNEDHRRYFELMNQVRSLKPVIAGTFSKKIKEYLVPAKDYDLKQTQKKASDEGELSLIDQDEMESMVLVKSIGERANAKYREQLSHLEARLEHLSLKSKNVFRKDALIPTNFCQAFDDALSDEFDNENKKLLFRMFDAEVANKLDALYDSINNRLIDADILPQIKISMPGHKTSSRPTSARPSPAVTDNAAEPAAHNEFSGAASTYQGGGTAGGGHMSGGGAGAGGSTGGGGTGTGGNTGGGGTGTGGNTGGSNIGGFAMTAAPGGAYRHSNQSSLQSQVSGGASGGGGSTGAGAGGAGSNSADGTTAPSATGTNYGSAGYSGGPQGGPGQNDAANTSGGNAEFQHYTAGMPASYVGRVLGNYIGTPFTPSTADKASENHGEFFPASTSQHFGHQEIIQALSEIQNLPQFEHPEETRFDAEAIKQAVLAEIAKKSGGAVTKRINQIAEKTIDFIELIFDAIIDDEDISDTIKALLLRLQIPIIKASMSDQEFFIYDSHPARVLLDTVADIGVGITDHEDEMYKHLDKIVSNILAEYELNTETFQIALDSLNSYIEEQDAITRAKEAEAQQELLRKHARATVLKALRATTIGKLLPESVHPLILKRWPTLMFNHYLLNGKENDGWITLVLTLRHIVESVQPITSAEQLAKLIAEKDKLFEETENYLNLSSRSKKDVRDVMTAYMETLQQHIDDANFTEEEVSVAEEVISQAAPVEEPPVEEESGDKPKIPPNVMPGMWFQVYMGEDQIPRRCKLSVIILEDSNLMFVNHKGELIIEKSFTEFNDEITSNKSKMIMGHSAFDNAFKSVINRLN